MIWFYAGKIVWPVNLIFTYPHWTIDAHAWWQFLFPAGVLATALGFLVLARRYRGKPDLCIHAHRIAHLPGTIIHGRYDAVTPAKNAWDLSKAWPQAELRIVPDAGHAMTEPGIVHEIINATDRYAVPPPVAIESNSAAGTM